MLIGKRVYFRKRSLIEEATRMFYQVLSQTSERHQARGKHRGLRARIENGLRHQPVYRMGRVDRETASV